MTGRVRLRDGWALIFDLDGVILHSTAIHNLAWEKYLRSQGVFVNGIQSRMLGKHNDDIVRDFLGSNLGETEVRRHGAQKEKVYRRLMRPVLGTHLVSGITPFLSGLDGVPTAVASNAERANIDFVLQGAGIRGRFRQVVDGGQVEKPKPSPEIYERAAGLLGVPPERCVVFEDSPVGVQAARDAGARVVGLRTTLPQLEGADLEIDNFHDPRLEPWLCNLTL